MKLLVYYAFNFVGLPYKWGGNHPCDGFDCSGLIQEILASTGMDPAGDQTAQGLYDFFKIYGKEMSACPGALCFYGKSDKEITHIAFMLDDNRIVEAGGGGSSVIDIASAIAHGAFIKIRPVLYRHDLIAIIKPNYPKWVEDN